MLKLRYRTPREWLDIATANFDAFLADHAHNERKVSQSALQLAVHHPDKPDLVDAMIEHAREELEHFSQVHAVLVDRGAALGFDHSGGNSGYMNKVRSAMRKVDVGEYLVDRLLLFSIIEARGCERFRILAEGLPAGEMRDFYTAFVRSEARHHVLFLDLAARYFDAPTIEARLPDLLDIEAEICASMPLRPALY